MLLPSLAGLTVVSAYRLPLFDQTSLSNHAAEEISRDQSVLTQSPEHVCKGTVGKLPIQAQHAVFFQLLKVNISIGTPLQNFTAVLDTGHAGPLLVPGSRCLEEPYSGCKNEQAWPHVYNASLSETFRAIGTPYSSEWGAYKYDGVLSQDNVQFGSLKLEKFVFEEWERENCRFIGCIAGGFDAVFGLAPPWVHAGAAPHPLRALVENGVLERDVFSLRLPNAFEDKGEIVLGPSDLPDNVEDPVTVPLQKVDNDPYHVKESWPIRFSELNFLNGSDALHISFDNFTAIIVSSFPGIMLPQNWGTILNGLIGGEDRGPYYHVMPCDSREGLPTLSLGVGHRNQTLELSGFDYVQELRNVPEPGAPSFCASMLFDAAEYGLGNDVVVLGSAFLGAFHTVFDMEERKINFARLLYNASSHPLS